MAKKITKEQFEAAEKVVAAYKEQVLEERKRRVPKFGDVVRTLDYSIGRYIGQGQALIKEEEHDDILRRDLVCFESDWEKQENDFLPSDSEIVNYIADTDWYD